MDTIRGEALPPIAWRLLRLAALVLALIALGSTPAASQVTFQRHHDHPGRWLSPRDQVQAGDGGFVICGDAYLVGTQQSRPYLMKLDATGDVAWTREYDLLDGFHHAESMVRIAAPSGDVYVVLAGLDQVQRPALFAVTSAGDLIGAKAYLGGPAELTMDELLPASDGGWLLLGRAFDAATGSDVAVLKLDLLGEVEWFRQLTGSIPYPLFGADDAALGALELPGGAGWVVSALVESDAYVGLWDADGQPLLARSYGLVGAAVFERVLAVLVTGAGRLVVIAHADLSNDRFPLILELDGTGALVSTQVLSLPMSATRALATSDGGFVVAGSSLIVPGAQGLRLAKYDAQLTLEWARQYDVSLTFTTVNPPANVIETADGGFLLTVAARDGLEPVQHVIKVAPDGSLGCGATPLPPQIVFDAEVRTPTTTDLSATVESVLVGFEAVALPVTVSEDCPIGG